MVLCSRLSYAEQRLSLAVHLQQSASEPCSSESANIVTPIFSPALQHGLSATPTGQNAEVLQAEVERLTADRAMLARKMQVSCKRTVCVW